MSGYGTGCRLFSDLAGLAAIATLPKPIKGPHQPAHYCGFSWCQPAWFPPGGCYTCAVDILGVSLCCCRVDTGRNYPRSCSLSIFHIACASLASGVHPFSFLMVFRGQNLLSVQYLGFHLAAEKLRNCCYCCHSLHHLLGVWMKVLDFQSFCCPSHSRIMNSDFQQKTMQVWILVCDQATAKMWEWKQKEG